MRVSQSLRGRLRLVLGGLGFAVCLACLVATWVVQYRVQRVVSTAFGYVETTLASLEERTHLINEHLGDAHDSLEELDDRVQQRMAELQEAPLAEAPDIDQLERQLYARVQLIADVVDFAQATADLVRQLLNMVESTTGFVHEESHTTRELIAAAKSLREEVDQSLALVEEVREGLAEIRASSDLEASAARMNTLYARLDTSLTKIGGYGQRFESAIGSLEEKCGELHTRIRHRLTLIAVAISLVFLWMAWGQFALAAAGRRMLKTGDDPPASPSATS